MLTIDGSQGEGGGQILRTSLALSLVSGTPFRLHHIRAGRTKPGLMRQHLTSVQAAARVGGAEVDGAAIGSRELVFKPKGARSGDGLLRPAECESRAVAGEYRISIGTAGSTTLVFQTILPPLLLADGPSTLILEGGTHNIHAPPFDFLAKAFLPLVERLGGRVEAQLERPGFYPAGGGRCVFTIEPMANRAGRLELLERGEIRRRTARALVSKLPGHIAERELRVVQRDLGWGDECMDVETVLDSPGPGNALMLEIESEHVTEVFTGFGSIGVPAEKVAEVAVEEAKRYLAGGVPVGEHLADQLLLPMALAGGGAFRTLPLSRHSVTNIDVIRMFLDVAIAVETGENRATTVRVG
jgi:RNA 3'-terminal phosphate cyclase (ATP)